MTDKLIQLNHQKRLDGYWTVLKEFADNWEDDLLELKNTVGISEAEVRAEENLLNLFWNLIELVDELSRESGGIHY